MVINKTYKYKLRLTKGQEERISQWMGTCRLVYNLALQAKIWAYRGNKINLSKFDLIKQLPPLRKEYLWIEDVPSGSLENTIERLDMAYKSFFKGGGFPKWAKKGYYNSITFRETLKQQTHSRITIPKIGSIKYFNSQPIKGEIRRATITKETNGYFISILTRQAIPDPPHNTLRESQAEVGVDMGVAYFLVTSDGEYINNPRYLEKSLKELRAAQRSLSRKKKGSSNWYKQKRVVAKLYAKVTNQRRDFINKVSTRLIQEYDFIGIEKLNIQGMIKSRLARSLSDVAWGVFIEKLSYKAAWQGKHIEAVNPAYTSQTCPICGCVNKDNRQSQSKFKCIECGFGANADHNAASNILARARASVREREPLGCALGKNH
jgi:putative transposase